MAITGTSTARWTRVRFNPVDLVKDGTAAGPQDSPKGGTKTSDDF